MCTMCALKLSDELLAEKFRRENTEQYHVLVRMHLSFLLELNTHESECFSEKGKCKKWNLVSFSSKKTKSKGVMEGAPLTQEGICQVYQLIEFIKKEQNICSEGIFRRTGSLERQQELRNLLSEGVTVDLEGGHFSVHDCASVLKGFLSELPDPLLTEAYFPAYCHIAELCGLTENPTQEEKLLEALQLILLLLPTDNHILVKDILNLLHLTASYESSNKMSADNLAKLFTPHLLCPRKLSPENLLTNSKILFGIVSFMIKNAKELFKIPQKLTVDFRARYERKMLSPSKRLNESITDAANTVFTFVDHERTAKENESNPTETALAQLYAHIQSLPESSKKRKLVKQFNKENGHGTPLQVIRSSMTKNKSFGDSIKKHIFQKGLVKSIKKAGFTQVRSNSEELLNSPQQTLISRARLFCTNCDSSTDVSNDESSSKKMKVSLSSNDNVLNEPCTSGCLRSQSEPDLSTENTNRAYNLYLTSTPACLPVRACPDLVFTPEDQDRKSMSPITRSTQRMTRAMQETMMTPRSRKPVLLLSGTNINSLPKIEKQDCPMDSVTEEITENTFSDAEPMDPKQFKKSKSEGDIISMPKTSDNFNLTKTPSSLTNTFREYLSSRDILTSSPADESFSSRTDDFNSTDFKDFSDNKLSESLLYCLDGNDPDMDEQHNVDTQREDKKLVLKPKQFDENGKAIIFETSF